MRVARDGTRVRRTLTCALAAAALGLGGAQACRCGELTSVFEVDAARHAALIARYGEDGLPASECEALCLRADETDGGADGGGASRHPTFAGVDSCKLVTIDLLVPAVSCTGTRTCF